MHSPPTGAEQPWAQACRGRLPAAGAGPRALAAGGAPHRLQRPLYLLLPAAGAGLQRLPRVPVRLLLGS